MEQGMSSKQEDGLMLTGESRESPAINRHQAETGDASAPTDAEANLAKTASWSATQHYATYIFWLMFGINLMNYLDRWVFSLVLRLIQTDQTFCAKGHPAQYCINDFQTGLLGSSFLLVYALGSLPLGVLADRIKRKDVIAAGVALWSLATVLTAFATSFMSLLATRALLGIGEASYNPAGISLLSSYFPREHRAQVLSRWGAGALVGFALGIIIGSLVAQLTGQWRLAFLFTGPPGLIFAFLMWKAYEPARQARDEDIGFGEHPQIQNGLRPILAQIRQLLRIRTLVICIIVQALGLFVIAPSASFIAVLLQRPPYNLSLAATGGAVLLLAVASVVGTIAGGYLADWLCRRTVGGRLMAAGLGFLLAAPCFTLALIIPKVWGFLPFFVLSGALLNVYSGPLSATMQDVVPPAMRASAIALAFMLAHLFGDLSAPSIVGGISYLLDPQHQTKLAHAMLITGIVPLVLAGIIGIWGSHFVGGEARAASGLIVLPEAKTSSSS
jgi:MFS family permease